MYPVLFHDESDMRFCRSESIRRTMSEETDLPHDNDLASSSHSEMICGISVFSGLPAHNLI
jgi:hypothetical protein